ncbi:DoxX family protein [Acidicapsa dinghuensis]|uniref:DoxX family protein n=1 Tax=Acidicapsa dinghuensis TaxID=2218256 RepID=A0ABW1EDI2_9BACT|nr:DoxX family protein [Acidicapsa dinghuensis]
MRLDRISLYAQTLLYILGGMNHFWHSEFYLHVMPDHYAHPEALVRASGVAEILGGVGLLVPATRRFSAAGIVLMLIVFFDVHLFMLSHQRRFPEVPIWLLWARIPLQFALLAWAAMYCVTRRTPSAQRPLTY